MESTAGPLLVAITGGTGSGKSTLAVRLAERLAALRPVVVRQDAYFREWPAEEAHQRTRNAPDALLWDVLRADLARLAAGLPAGPPPRPAPSEAGPREPGDLVLVEGHLLLWDPGVRALCALKVFLDVPDEERVLRRVLRDVARGGDAALPRSADWYRRDVLPNHARYTAPARWWADLILPAAPVTDAAFAALASAIEAAAAARAAAAPPI